MTLMPHKCAEIKPIHLGKKTILVSSDGFYRYAMKWKKPCKIEKSLGVIATNLPFNKKGVKTKSYCTYTMRWLVATAFCDKPFKDKPHQDTIIHKDGDIMNNHPSNLEWVTKSKTVYRYNTLGKYTNIKYESITEASFDIVGNKSGCGSISFCCNSKKYDWHGFEWSFHPPSIYKHERREMRINVLKNNKIRNSTRTDYKGRSKLVDTNDESPDTNDESPDTNDESPGMNESQSPDTNDESPGMNESQSPDESEINKNVVESVKRNDIDELNESLSDDVYMYTNTPDNELFDLLYSESFFEF